MAKLAKKFQRLIARNLRHAAGPQPDRLRFQDPAIFLDGAAQLAGRREQRRTEVFTEHVNQERHAFFTRAIMYLLCAGVRGDYYEFGCYSANTFRTALSLANTLGLDDMHYYAFDSFAGLPEPVAGVSPESGWTAGSMCMTVEQFWEKVRPLRLSLNAIEVIPGFFDQSLTAERQRACLATNRKIALLNVDCDLYESAVPVFRFVEPLLQEGSLIYLDDFFAGYRGNPRKGVAAAFHEFAARSAWAFQSFHPVGGWGQSFIAYPKS
jgi:hypothetical protein